LYANIPKPQLTAEEEAVVQILNGTLHRDAITKLDHGCTFLALQELDLHIQRTPKPPSMQCLVSK